MKTIKDYFCEGCPFKDAIMGSVGFDTLEDIRRILEDLEYPDIFLGCLSSERFCTVNEVLKFSVGVKPFSSVLLEGIDFSDYREQ